MPRFITQPAPYNDFGEVIQALITHLGTAHSGYLEFYSKNIYSVVSQYKRDLLNINLYTPSFRVPLSSIALFK